MATMDLKDSTVIAMLAEDDLEQGRRFWRDTVGLEEVWSDDQGEEVAFKAGNSVFALYKHQGGSKADHTQLAFQVDDVRQAKQSLEGKGIKFEEYDLPNVRTQNGIAEMGDQGQGAWFLDPGGNIVGIFTASSTMTDAIQGQRQTTAAGLGMM